MTMPVPTPEHLSAVCKPGQGDGSTCRYLVMGGGGMACAKSDPAISAAVNARVLSGTMKAQGDNCTGPEEFLPL